MNNPLSLVKQTRTRWDQELQKPILEVQIQLEGVPKSWIPLEVLTKLWTVNQVSI